MKRANCKTRTYTALYDAEHDEQMMVDIVDDGECFNAWIYAKNKCHKSYMFGLPKNNPESQNWGDAKAIIMANVPDYLDSYWEDIDILEAYYNVRFSHDHSVSDEAPGCPYCNN